ncbi:MAG: ASKHA domain-containing protein [Massiliimalia sp.]|jgi:uncharacterized 2Fe-2S/4Fe-4S cluster protein (DUF4445 family)
MFTITIYYNGKTQNLQYQEPVLLSSALQEAGIPIKMLCAGRGTCGKCRVKAAGNLSDPTQQEIKVLGEELKQNIRLACMTKAEGDCQVTVESQSMEIVTEGNQISVPVKPIGSGYGAAVDIGTTTVALYLYRLSDGSLLGKGAFPNPQSAYGADVISRIGAALEGKDAALQNCIAAELEKQVANLCENHKVAFEELSTIVITGNTTMLYLLMRENVKPLSCAPFEISEYYGSWIDVKALHWTMFPALRCYLPRTMSAFVGSDITCSLLAGNVLHEDGCTVLVDIGTNGEMGVHYQGRLVCCSTAAGPAFEGAGITMGSMAVPGAISKVWIENEKIAFSTIGDAKAKGICGSGLIDALACFLTLGLIDETGYIDEEKADEAGYLAEYDDDAALRIGDSDVLLTQKDVRSIQLAKAAVCAGFLSLLNAVGLSAAQVDRLILAGGFGSFIDRTNAAVIGLIPKEFAQKAHSIGNASGSGASMILLNSDCLAESEALAKQAEGLELSSSAYFMEQYVECMGFEV